MNLPRQLLAPLLAAATLVVAAAPTPPAPSLEGLDWQPIFGVAEGQAAANGAVWSIVVDGDDLYVGGAFTDFAGVATADRVARWNHVTQHWEGLAPDGATDGAITTGSVYSLAVTDGVVYVGGHFTVNTGGGDCNNLAWFDRGAATWNGFGACPASQVIDPSSAVHALYADTATGDLYVGGTFVDANGDPLADYAVRGRWSACVGGVLGTCVASEPEVTVCGGVTISCADGVPNAWYPLGDDGAGGPALSAEVSAFARHPDGGVAVLGNFGLAGGVTGANSNGRFDLSQSPPWFAQGTPAVTMYGALTTSSDQLFVTGLENVHLFISGTTWRALCTGQLGTRDVIHGSLALAANGLLIVGGSDGLYACDTAEDGAATLIPGSSQPRALTSYKGAVIVGGFDGLNGTEDRIALLGTLLPSTATDSRQPVDALVLLVSLAALTALAGTQLLKRS